MNCARRYAVFNILLDEGKVQLHFVGFYISNKDKVQQMKVVKLKRLYVGKTDNIRVNASSDITVCSFKIADNVHQYMMVFHICITKWDILNKETNTCYRVPNSEIIGVYLKGAVKDMRIAVFLTNIEEVLLRLI